MFSRWNACALAGKRRECIVTYVQSSKLHLAMICSRYPRSLPARAQAFRQILLFFNSEHSSPNYNAQTLRNV